MTSAEEKGLVVGEYYAIDSTTYTELGKLLKDDGSIYPAFEFQNIPYPVREPLGYIRHPTPEEKSHILLGINPFTKERLP